MYQSIEIVLKNSDSKFKKYCKENCMLAKNLKNATIFRCRQILFANQKTLNHLSENEINVLFEFNLFDEFQNNKAISIPSYNKFDKVFRNTHNPDYLSELPRQSSNQVVKETLRDFSSYFESIKKYKNNPSDFLGIPKIPKYIKASQIEFTITNQDAVIYKNNNQHYLKLPKTKIKVPLGKLNINGKLKEVKVKPFYDTYKISIIVENVDSFLNENNNRYLGIDLGVNNFATVNNNCGLKPFIINGKNIKSYNQWYNKELSKLKSNLDKYNNSLDNETPKKYTSKRIQKLNKSHYFKTNDFYNKVANNIITYALQNNISFICVGKNNNWKQEIDLGSKNNQTFCFIAHALFIKKLTNLGLKNGITVIPTEESYTSKSSLLDFDELNFEEDDEKLFSGRRIERGIYQTKNGILINADVNGAGNIIRKVFPHAFDKINDFRYMYGDIKKITIA